MGTSKRIDLVILLLIAFHSALVWSGQPQLKILPEQSSVYSPSSVSYVLTCKGIADEDGAFSEMQWRDPRGDVIEEETRTQSFGVRQLSMNTLKLTFPKPSVSDSGRYNCSALYEGTEMLQASIFVSFYDDIKFEDCNSQQSLILGTPGEIHCRAVGNPAPDISWSKDRQSITSGSRYTLHTDYLMISKVIEEDRGEYVVEAYVPVTGQNKYMNIEVTVQIPPQIEELPEEISVIETEPYAIQCKATGFPDPVFKWLDGKLRDLSDVEGFSVNAEDGTLTINRVERDYSGEYTCEAKNDAGTVERKMMLKVIVKPTIIQFDNITQNEGKGDAFICIADGDPAPTVSIRNDKGQTFEGNEDGRISVERTLEGGRTKLTLTISQVRRADDGLYYCAAENGAAHVEKVGHLQVQFAPNMSLTPLREVKTWSANPVNLTCIVEANPNASIQWKFQNEIIEDTDPRYVVYGRVSTSNLLVKLSDAYRNNIYGTYTCIAQNLLGDDSIDIRLDEATVPGPLSQVIFDQVTPTTISFKFLGPSVDGGLPITSFIGKYRIDTAPESEERMIEWPKGSAYIVSKLKPRAHYKFKLAAKNVVGIGNWKTESYVMPEETFPSIPTFITVQETVSDHSDRFEIRWIIPDDNGKPINFYHIRYFKVEREGNNWKQIGKDINDKVEEPETTSYGLANLESNTFYKVELRANNEVGNSLPGIVVFRTRSGEILDEQTSRIENGNFPLVAIIATAVVAVLIILIVMDIVCYLRFHCGLLYVMRYHTCGRSPSSEKVKDVTVEDGPECVKEISAANNGKIKSEIKNPSPKATSPVQPPSDKQFDSAEEKSKSEVDNLAFDQRRLDFPNCDDRINHDYPHEGSPMISFSGGRDARPADLIIDQNYKNRSPKGSKSSLGKSSPV